MRKTFSRLMQRQKEGGSGGEAVVQQQDELQGHRKAQSSPDTIESSDENTDAVVVDVNVDVDVAADALMSQGVHERRLDGTSKVDSVAGAGCSPEVYDKFGKGDAGDNSLDHPAPALAGTVSAEEQAIVAMYSSCSDTEEESCSNTTTDSSSKKVVSFGLIQVREYNRVVGDNPTVRIGPPMSIGWEFVQKEAVPVDAYEERKRPRTSDLRMMGSITRISILRFEFNVSLEEIRAAEKIVRKIQRQRWQTILQGKMAAAVAYAMESVKRKMHRIFSNEPRLEDLLPPNSTKIQQMV
jgi:hypothetical protein